MFKYFLKRKLYLSTAILILLIVFLFISIEKRGTDKVFYIPNNYISNDYKSIILDTSILKENTITEVKIVRDIFQKENISKRPIKPKQQIIDKEFYNFYGETKFKIMEIAARTGNIKLLNDIIPMIDDINISLFPRNSTMMMVAARHGQVKFIEQLIMYGAEIDLTTDYGYNALKAAVKSESIETIQYLLDNGVSISPYGGISGLTYAVGTGNVDIIKVLLHYGAEYSDPSDVSPIMIAINQDNENLVQDMIAANIDLNKKELFTGTTPLIAAVSAGGSNIAEMILNEEVDTEIHDYYGNSALHYAAQKGDTEVVDLLVHNGSDIDDVNNITGESALILAAKRGFCGTVSSLIDAGADTGIVDTYGMSASDYLQANLDCDFLI